jgi:hypothetical protein
MEQRARARDGVPLGHASPRWPKAQGWWPNGQKFNNNQPLFDVEQRIDHSARPPPYTLNKQTGRGWRAPSTCRARPQVRFRGEADMNPQARLVGSVENDPTAVFGTHSQNETLWNIGRVTPA